jgi:hypothetical protein
MSSLSAWLGLHQGEDISPSPVTSCPSSCLTPSRATGHLCSANHHTTASSCQRGPLCNSKRSPFMMSLSGKSPHGDDQSYWLCSLFPFRHGCPLTATSSGHRVDPPSPPRDPQWPGAPLQPLKPRSPQPHRTLISATIWPKPYHHEQPPVVSCFLL